MPAGAPATGWRDQNGARADARSFVDDIGAGNLHLEKLADEHALRARDLLEELRHVPLRMLDALHLAIPQSIGAGVLATADLRMARAAEHLVSPW